MWSSTERNTGISFLKNDQPSLAYEDVVTIVLHRIKYSSDSKMQRLVHLLTMYDVHHISPRKMQVLCQGLRWLNLISDYDYFYLSFQPDMHPKFNETIGKYYGRTARPDEPQDMVALWEERVISLGTGENMMRERTERMLKILLHYDVLHYAVTASENSDSHSSQSDPLLS